MKDYENLLAELENLLKSKDALITKWENKNASLKATLRTKDRIIKNQADEIESLRTQLLELTNDQSINESSFVNKQSISNSYQIITEPTSLPNEVNTALKLLLSATEEKQFATIAYHRINDILFYHNSQLSFEDFKLLFDFVTKHLTIIVDKKLAKLIVLMLNTQNIPEQIRVELINLLSEYPDVYQAIKTMDHSRFLNANLLTSCNLSDKVRKDILCTTQITMDSPIENLSLSVSTFNALLRSGIHTVSELTTLSETELLEIHRLGKKGVKEIQTLIKALNLNTD